MLFIVVWFVPEYGNSFEDTPADMWHMLFMDPNHIGENLMFIGRFSLIAGIPAISIGWVLHCAVVMIMDARTRTAR